MTPLYTATKLAFMTQAARPWHRYESGYADTENYRSGDDKLSINTDAMMAFLYENAHYPEVNCVSIRFINKAEYDAFRAVLDPSVEREADKS